MYIVCTKVMTFKSKLNLVKIFRFKVFNHECNKHNKIIQGMIQNHQTLTLIPSHLLHLLHKQNHNEIHDQTID